eukprot:1042454-Pelagomonas_calceolata.AAC.1
MVHVHAWGEGVETGRHISCLSVLRPSQKSSACASVLGFALPLFTAIVRSCVGCPPLCAVKVRLLHRATVSCWTSAMPHGSLLLCLALCSAWVATEQSNKAGRSMNLCTGYQDTGQQLNILPFVLHGLPRSCPSHQTLHGLPNSLTSHQTLHGQQLTSMSSALLMLFPPCSPHAACLPGKFCAGNWQSRCCMS